MTTDLYALAWRKVALVLRNTRNAYAREHPLSIFQAVFKFAAARAGWPPGPAWFFHPAGERWGARVQKGQDYRLELIFLAQGPEEIAAFLEALAAHLADPARNFRLVECSEPRERGLSDLQAEHAHLSPQPRELCLDFLTPLAFKPADPKKRWLLTRPGLAEALDKRFRVLFGLELESEGLWEGVEVLPYYWDYVEHRHASKSNDGVQFINGAAGPLYLKGDLTPLLPLLLLGSELHLGPALAAGQGCYRLEAARPFFDPLLETPGSYLSAWRYFEADSDAADGLPDFQTDPEGAALDIMARALDDGFTPEPVRGERIPKEKGGERMLAEFSPRDAFLQRALSELLEPVCDRMLEDASVGHRRSRTRRAAWETISRGLAEGFAWAVQADIASCLDSMDWGVLESRLDRLLPTADANLRRLIRSFAACPIEIGGGRVERTRGLLPGSPLTPLLANLYLDPLDEAMEARGRRFLRDDDDILILVRGREEAGEALADLKAALLPLGLELREEKTALRPLGAGMEFMGADLGEELQGPGSRPPALRKTLYVREQYAFLGLDRDTLVVRREGRVTARVPLRRIEEVVVFGNSGISVRLIHRCSRDGIPLSFCSPLGYYVNTLRPDSKAHFRLAGLHAARHAALGPAQALDIARRLVAGKLAGYAAWIGPLREPGAKEAAARLEEQRRALAGAERVESLRGMEALAARGVFGFLNSRVKDPAFQSRARVPRRGADRYNALLDFAYFLLFCQVNVLLRGRGLNPYLGLLHSHKDNYESLAADLMEPFRHRMDHMVIRAVNLGMVKPGDMSPRPGGGFQLGKDALPSFLEAFERELALAPVGELASLRDLISAQVGAVARWAEGEGELRVHDPSRPDRGGIL